MNYYLAGILTAFLFWLIDDLVTTIQRDIANRRYYKRARQTILDILAPELTNI